MTESNVTPSSPSLVPMGLTIGLGIFALVLGLAGFGFRLYMGDTLAMILPTLMVTGLIFWVLLPAFFVLGSMVLNRFSGKPPIQSRNALTLGLLFSCVAMLWLMSMYS
ncbi:MULTISPECIES: hypothetical protein [unclassified Moraxella]|uniref:hypothetical protein n=1 Tax=unclassified Moraxella TaxID=2685852 RepID=UPI003AF4DD21